MSAHTPGPWKFNVEDLRGEKYWFVWAEGAADHIVDGIHTDDNGEADARLVAAAPDLLAALHVLLDANTAHGASGPDWLEAVEDARAAVAKATGVVA